MEPRKQVEEAKVDLDVAVAGLYAAQSEDAFTRSRQGRRIRLEPRQLQRGISFYRGADFGRPVVIDVEAAIRQLARQDRLNRLVDERTRVRFPDAVVRRIKPELQQDEIRFQRGVGG